MRGHLSTPEAEVSSWGKRGSAEIEMPTGRAAAEGQRLARSVGVRNSGTAATEPRGLHPGWYLVALPIVALVVISALAYRGLGSERAVGANAIQHVIIIVQQDRSFDNYFGTYPGAV